MALQIAAIGLVIGLLPLLFWLTWLLQGNVLRLEAGLGEFGIIIGTIIITVLVHEWVHGVVYWLLGYQVTYGASLRLMAAYAAAFEQFQQRSHNLLVALAPLIVINGTLLPLLAIPQPLVTLTVFTALLFNSSGAVADLYLTWRLLRLPRATLLYDVDPKTMLIFLPIIEKNAT